MSSNISFFSDLSYVKCVKHSAFWAMVLVGSTHVEPVLLMYLVNTPGINSSTVTYSLSSVSPWKIFLYLKVVPNRSLDSLLLTSASSCDAKFLARRCICTTLRLCCSAVWRVSAIHFRASGR